MSRGPVFDRGLGRLAAAFVALWVAATFWPVLSAGFINLDDNVYLLSNRKVAGLSTENLRAIFFNEHQGQYGPLVLLTFAVERHFFGLDPRIYHATNLALHALTSALVYVFMAQICRSRLAAFLAAALFAVHPTRVDAFALVTSRKDALYAPFYVLSLIHYVRYHKGAPRGYAWSFVFFALALLSKPMAVTLPAALVLLDVFVLGGVARLRRLVPFVAASVIFTLITLAVHPASVRAPTEDLATRLRWLVYAPVFYLSKLAAPVGLSGFYPKPDRLAGGPSFLYVWAPALFAALAAAVAWAVKASRRAAFGLLFFLATLLPILPFYQFSPAIVADRYTYLPAIGIFFVIAEGVSAWLGWAFGPKTPYAAALLAVVVLGPLSASARSHALTYRDSLTFWNDTLGKYPDLAFAHAKRGDCYAEAGKLDQALDEYDRAIALEPDLARAYTNRGVLYFRQGRAEQALRDFERAIALRPREAAAAYNGRGALRAMEGRTREAAADFERALDIDPDLGSARENLKKAQADAEYIYK